jgi:hypothetical protein
MGTWIGKRGHGREAYLFTLYEKLTSLFPTEKQKLTSPAAREVLIKFFCIGQHSRRG